MWILFWQLESQKYLRSLLGSSSMLLSLLPVFKISLSVCFILLKIHSLKGQGELVFSWL